MKRFKLIICLFLLLATIGSYVSLHAQEKKYEYWFVVPDASRLHDDNPIFFMITAGASEAEVEISMPKNPQFVTQKKSLKAYESWKKDYTSLADVDMLENSINNSGVATNKGVLITSTAPISGYYELDGSRSGQKEIFTFKGDKALGTEFYTPLQTYYPVHTHADAYRQVQIVATEDNTSVTFKAPVRVANSQTGGFFAANTQNTIILQRGQTLLLREYQRNEIIFTEVVNGVTVNHLGLMGTHVKANKPIAITTYEDSVNSQGQDPIGDQIVPVDQVGTNYIVIKGYTKLNNTNGGVKNTVDNVYILATKDDTQVKMDGVVKGTIAKAGQFMRFDIDDAYTGSQFRYFDTGDKPVYCFHQSGVVGELGGALIPSMYGIGSNRISFYNQNLNVENSIFLVYRKSAKDSFKIQFANQQAPVALTVQANATGVNADADEWVFSKQKLTGSVGTVTISNEASAFALGYFAAPAGTALYGYLSNFGNFSFKDRITYWCGDSYTFDGGYAKSYLWTDPTGQTATTPTLKAIQSGKYALEVNQDPRKISDDTYLKLQNFEGEYKFPKAAFVNQPVDFSIKIQTIDPEGVYENEYDVEYEWTFSHEASGRSVTQTLNEQGLPLTTNDKVEVKGVVWPTSGRRTITVKINNKTANSSTTITKDIIINDYLDNMYPDVNCSVERPVTNWEPILKGRSDSKVHTLAQPFVGDIDGDGKLEVVTTNMDPTSPSYNWSTSILIFDNDLKKWENDIAPPNFFIYSQTTTPLALLRLPGETQALIVVAFDNNKNMENQRLIAFKPDGTIAWTSTESIFNPTTPNSHRVVSPSLVVGDIDNDGIPEILAGDRIFCAKTGELLAKLPGYLTDPQHGRGARSLNAENTPTQPGWSSKGNFTTMPVLADIDNDGRLEVVGGNTTYKVTINSRTDHTQNRVDVLARANGIDYDGFVSVADVDLDGQLDVVSITNSIGDRPSLVVWNGTTGEIIAGPVAPRDAGRGGSRVFIGDVDFHIDPSGHPELFFSYASRLVGFKYDPTPGTPVTDRLKEMWTKDDKGKDKGMLTTTDLSGATTLSMFDFDQSGSPKLVYRDQENLRIIDAVVGRDTLKIPCFSATHSEYPIVVDFDKDGHADILVSGAANSGEINSDVRLYWFRGEKNNWAPARTVWNQHGYNAVHVNEDLTIPHVQINPSTIFPGKGKPVRPYNGYLLQQTTLDRYGEPLYLAPNVQIVDGDKITYSYDNITDKLIINNLKLINIGDAVMNGSNEPIMISVYNQEIAPQKCITTHLEPRDIDKGEIITVTIEVPNFGQYLPTDNLVISINDDGTGKTVKPVCKECEPNESNTFTNIVLSTLAWANPYKNCIGGEVELGALDFSTTGTNVTYQWFYPNANPLLPNREVEIKNLQLSHAGRYTVAIEGINDDLSIRYTLPHLSVAPPTMYWSGKEDNNWNNIENWASDINGTPLNPKAIPAGCTNVHVPYLSGTGAKYPSLNPKVTPQDPDDGETGIYGKPEASEIIFHYGSELAYPHQLAYKRAKVQYNFGHYSTLTSGSQPTANKDGASALGMKRDRWYALAAPLKNMATGDFAFGGYPYTWQALNDIISGNEIAFESKNMTNDINLVKTNNAIVIKSGLYQAGQTGYKDHKHLQSLQGVLEIPYFENEAEAEYHPGHGYDRFTGYSTFYYFNAKTLQTIHNPVGKMKRGKESYRFVFEKDNDKINSITLNGETIACYVMEVDATTSKHVLIGNPFIASINMENFYEVNKDVLDKNVSGYHLYVDNNGLKWENYNYKMTDGTYNAVNSLQSFIVSFKSSGANQKLYFPLEGNYALTGTATNAMPKRLELPGALSVSVKNSDGMQGDYAELSPASQNGLTDNVSKLISKEDSGTPEVFLIGRNNAGYNLMQVYESEDREIRLGVRYSNIDNELTLTFNQIKEFASLTGTTPVLIDKTSNVKQNLIEIDSYTFRQSAVSAESNYTDNDRFVIRFAESNGAFFKDNGLTVSYIDNLLTVDSSIGIQKVELYNLSGQQIFSSSLLDGINTRYTQPVNLPFSVYIAKVTGVDNKTMSCKFIVQ